VGLGGGGFGCDDYVVRSMSVLRMVKRSNKLLRCVCTRHSFCRHCAPSDIKVPSYPIIELKCLTRDTVLISLILS
jgi:hypothetical protein